MLKKWLIFAIVGLLLINPSGASGADKPDNPKERLKAAWALKRTSFKKEAEVKKNILLETVAFYQTLLDDFPTAHAECAQACFRMGEIYRSLKMVTKAEPAFKMVLTYEKNTGFAARALKELGHIYRRNKEFETALGYYERILTQCPAQKDRCAEALLWIGKTHLKMKGFEKARTVFLSLPDKYPQFPVEGIRAIDLAANTYLAEHKISEAEALITHWRQYYETLMGKDKKTDKKIEKALDRMKSPDKLKSTQVKEK